jgi:hypothetical protein
MKCAVFSLSYRTVEANAFGEDSALSAETKADLSTNLPPLAKRRRKSGLSRSQRY